MVESLAYGTGYDRVSLTVDRLTGDVVAKSAVLEDTAHDGIAPTRPCASSWRATRNGWPRSASACVGTLPEALDTEGLNEAAADAQRASRARTWPSSTGATRASRGSRRGP